MGISDRVRLVRRTKSGDPEAHFARLVGYSLSRRYMGEVGGLYLANLSIGKKIMGLERLVEP